jgi:hypothetical protein
MIPKGTPGSLEVCNMSKTLQTEIREFVIRQL